MINVTIDTYLKNIIQPSRSRSGLIKSTYSVEITNLKNNAHANNTTNFFIT